MRRRCLQLSCGRLIGSGSYCSEHKPYGKGWGATSAAVLVRDGNRCRCDGCGSCAAMGVGPCQRPATTADHINGNVQDNRLENLRAMCRSCNTAKGGL